MLHKNVKDVFNVSKEWCPAIIVHYLLTIIVGEKFPYTDERIFGFFYNILRRMRKERQRNVNYLKEIWYLGVVSLSTFVAGLNCLKICLAYVK